MLYQFPEGLVRRSPRARIPDREHRRGSVQQAADHLLVGLVMDYAGSPTTTNSSDPTCACFVRLTDTTRQVLARVGSSFEYAENSSIYFDYQYGDFWNSTGHFTTNRLFSGIKHQIYSCFMRARGSRMTLGAG
jgi:hypothetical protein